MLSKSIKHSVVLKEAEKSASEIIKKATVTDLINAYKRIMISAIIRGNNKLNWEEVYNLSLTIQVRNGNVEQAMRVLKKKLQKDGLLKSLKDKQYYEKPSAKKRRKKKEAIANFKKKQKKLLATRGY